MVLQVVGGTVLLSASRGGTSSFEALIITRAAFQGSRRFGCFACSIRFFARCSHATPNTAAVEIICAWTFSGTENFFFTYSCNLWSCTLYTHYTLRFAQPTRRTKLQIPTGHPGKIVDTSRNEIEPSFEFSFRIPFLPETPNEFKKRLYIECNLFHNFLVSSWCRQTDAIIGSHSEFCCVM